MILIKTAFKNNIAASILNVIIPKYDKTATYPVVIPQYISQAFRLGCIVSLRQHSNLIVEKLRISTDKSA